MKQITVQKGKNIVTDYKCSRNVKLYLVPQG